MFPYYEFSVQVRLKCSFNATCCNIAAYNMRVAKSCYLKTLNDWSRGEQSLTDLLYSKTKQKQNLKTALKFQRSRATAVNISRVTVNCFPFDVIVFAMLPAHGIWRVTVSLLDVI